MLGRLIALVVPLGIDSFVVAAALGLRGPSVGQRLRISVLFSVFEGGTPVIGLVIGRPIGTALGGVADYVAIAVLMAFGVFTAVGKDNDEAKIDRFATARGRSAILLGVSVSLDELAIGFTLGLLRLPVVAVLVAIAVQAFVVSQLGLRLGARLSERVREGAEKLAGVTLFGLGVVLLVQRLAGA